MKAIFCIVSGILLSACSGDSSNQFGPECGANSSCALPELPPAQSIVGLWNSEKTTNGVTDIRYTEIGASGEYVEHDYQQDEIGSGENCYVQNIGRIWRYADSSDYQVQLTAEQSATQQPATIFRQGDSLSVNLESGSDELWPELLEITVDDLVLCQ